MVVTAVVDVNPEQFLRYRAGGRTQAAYVSGPIPNYRYILSVIIALPAIGNVRR